MKIEIPEGVENIFNNQYPFSVTVTFDENQTYQDIFEWAEENKIQMVFQHPFNYHFKDKEEAALFKLTWQ